MPPPIWIIMCSFRTVITTAVYKFILKQEVTELQLVGAFLISNMFKFVIIEPELGKEPICMYG